jgi:coproporphyrinogen III oxidase-like Fe-S oxidoreductase
MYETIRKTLRFARYEISNYGEPCRHNQNVWDGQPYLGFGDGACGRLLIDGVWYETGGDASALHPLSVATRAREKIITGMRQTRGLLLTPDVRNAIDWDFVEKSSLFAIHDSRLTTHEKGLLILDDLLVRLVK